MKTIDTLDNNVFRHLITTIGALPTSFIDSMSYYEMIAWLVNYLKTEIVPTINDEAEAIKEIQEWIETLDLQDEVDNKLDEMAESGELAEIIAQYIQLNGVLAYDTIADMAAAENLVAGSIARVLGNSAYATGDGAFYRVRALINTDVIDGVNLVGITNEPTLVAERIPDYYTEQNTTNIATNATAIAGIKDDLANKKYGVLAISRNTTNYDKYIYFSEDGENFYRVGSKLTDANIQCDSGAMIIINGTYYYFGSDDNSFYTFSDDLVNWSTKADVYTTTSKQWAPYPFYDPVNDKYYVFSALQYQNGTVHNAVGNDAYYFKIIRQEFTVNDDKSLTFDSPVDVKYVANDSYIDPAVCYDTIHGYTIAIKNEVSCKIEMYNTNDLSNIGSSFAYLDGAGTEAPQLIDEDGYITMYVHDYALNLRAVTGLVDDMGQTYSKVNVATPNFFYNTANLRRHCCKMPEIFRHAAVIPCDKKALDIVTSLGVKMTPLFICDDYAISGDMIKPTYVFTGGSTYELANLPYAMYGLGGGSTVPLITLNVRAYYDTPLKLLLGPTNVKFSGDTNEHTVTTAATSNDVVLIECPLKPNRVIETPFGF